MRVRVKMFTKGFKYRWSSLTSLELQNMNHEKPLLYHVFQLKFGQVYSAGKCDEHTWKPYSSVKLLVDCISSGLGGGGRVG
jgi:hypothetical protein